MNVRFLSAIDEKELIFEVKGDYLTSESNKSPSPSSSETKFFSFFLNIAKCHLEKKVIFIVHFLEKKKDFM